MSTGPTIDDLPADTSEGRAAPGPSHSGWRRMRLALLLGWIVLLGAGVFVGERPSSLDQLEGDVASGRVHEVRVLGGMKPGSTGFSTVEVHWRSGLFGYTATVIQAQPRGRAPAAIRHGSTPVLSQEVGALLSADQPGLRVIRDGELGGGDASFYGWRFPSWVGWSSLVLGLTSFVLLVTGPQPWRATRWAWFWLMGAFPPLGVLAFLLLSGPTPLLPAPRSTARRLTGGWAFLLAVVISSAHS